MRPIIALTFSVNATMDHPASRRSYERPESDLRHRSIFGLECREADR
jgi:hypothetical protein